EQAQILRCAQNDNSLDDISLEELFFMTLSPDIQSTLQRYQKEIEVALRRAVFRASEAATQSGVIDILSYYGQMQYHLGWVDANFLPVTGYPGKLLRPTLLLLAYEVAGAEGITASTDYLRRALPAAAAIELTHNFTLIHDDIEDGDAKRHHRAPLWKQGGIPLPINPGDGMFALDCLTLGGVVEEGVAAAVQVARGW